MSNYDRNDTNAVLRSIEDKVDRLLLLEERVANIEKFQWKATGVVAVVALAIEAGIQYLHK